MIRPHGNDLIDRYVDAVRSDIIRQDFAELCQVTLDAELLADLRNLAPWVHSPLREFMSQHDFFKMINDMMLESGVTWTLPIVRDVDVDARGQIDAAVCRSIDRRPARAIQIKNLRHKCDS